MTRPADMAHPVSLTRAAGIDVGVLLFGTGAALVSFLLGNGEPRWHGIVFAPVVFMLAVITMRLILSEVRALLPVLPDTPHKGQAFAALMVAIVMAVVVGPMLLIMPFVFFGSL